MTYMHIGLYIVMGIIYIIPTIIAFMRGHPNKIPIMIVNIIIGAFYGLGWVIAFIWAFTSSSSASPTVSSSQSEEIEKLFELKKKGILTEDEFVKKKEKILGDN